MGGRQSKMEQAESDQDRRAQAAAPPNSTHVNINANGNANDATKPPLPTIAVPSNTALDPAHEQPQTPSSPQSRSRRGSFSFLRRSRSREITSKAGPESGRKLSRRKNRAVSKEEATKQQVGIAPQLPSYHNLPQMNTPFVDGASETPNNASASASASAQPPLSSSANFRASPQVNTAEKPVSRSGYNPNAFYQRHQMADRNPATPSPQLATAATSSPSLQPSSHDSYARTESMKNRGRYSYATAGVNGNVNSPRRVRRRKDPTPFNVLVLGTKGSGKTSFVEFLQQALTRPVRVRRSPSANFSEPATKKEVGSVFTSHYLETELEGERIGLTVYDSVGIERTIIDIQLREVSYFLESKFHDTFNEEQKVLRAPGIQDTHIHCVFLVLDPVRLDNNIASATPQKDKHGDIIGKPRMVGALDERLDVSLLETLKGKTTVIPVISKADTLTTAHMAYLERMVWDSMKKVKIDPLAALNMDSDEDEEDSEPTALAAPKEGGDFLQVDNEEKRDPSVSSVYDSAREEEDESDAKSDTTVNNDKDKLKPTDGINGVTPGDKAQKPQHDEIRVSTMSENVDLPMLPLSVISPDMHDRTVIGRRFPWGFADPYNTDHCDFPRLLDSVFNEWRAELREASREKWYEGWRTNRLKLRGSVQSPARASTGQGRTVSGAAAYGGKGPESQMKPPSTIGASSTTSRAVSAADIGVAVSSNSQNSKPPPVPSTASLPAPKSSYRGVGTY